MRFDMRIWYSYPVRESKVIEVEAESEDEALTKALEGQWLGYDDGEDELDDEDWAVFMTDEDREAAIGKGTTYTVVVEYGDTTGVVYVDAESEEQARRMALDGEGVWGCAGVREAFLAHPQRAVRLACESGSGESP